MNDVTFVSVEGDEVSGVSYQRVGGDDEICDVLSQSGGLLSWVLTLRSLAC